MGWSPSILNTLEGYWNLGHEPTSTVPQKFPIDLKAVVIPFLKTAKRDNMKLKSNIRPYLAFLKLCIDTARRRCRCRRRQ